MSTGAVHARAVDMPSAIAELARYVALSTRVERAAFGVPGTPMALVVDKSLDFAPFKSLLLLLVLYSAADLRLMLTLWQVRTDECMDMSMDTCIDMCMDRCMDVCADIFVDTCVDMCIDMGTDLRIDRLGAYVCIWMLELLLLLVLYSAPDLRLMLTLLRIDLCVDVHMDMCMDMCVDVCIGICVDLCADLCTGVRIYPLGA